MVRAVKPGRRKRERRWWWRAGLLSLVALGVGCANDLDTTRRLPPGERLVARSVFEALCDRVGAQSLPEDLEGASYRDICHGEGGKVDRAKLPPTGDAATAAVRELAVAKVETMGRRRAELVEAIAATIADVPVGTRGLHAALQDLLARLLPLYDDGSLPGATRAMGELAARLRDDPAAHAATARLLSRKGYRPFETALGAARAVLAYPDTASLVSTALAPLAPFSDPADVGSAPGALHGRFAKLLEAAAEELRTADATPAGPAVRIDPATGAPNRPRTTAELLYALASTDAGVAPAGAVAIPLVRRDERGLAKLLGAVDRDGDGYGDVDALGRPVDAAGQPLALPAPFAALSTADAARGPDGLALGDAGALFEGYDGARTLGAATLRELSALATPGDEATPSVLSGLLLGAVAQLGDRTLPGCADPDAPGAAPGCAVPDGAAPSARTYAGNAQGPEATVKYAGFVSATSPLVDLVHAAGALLGDPRMDDLLALTEKLATEHPHELARAVGALLDAKKIADAHPEASLPASSMLWDDLLDLVAAIAAEPKLLDDVVRSMLDPDATLGAEAFPALLTLRDEMAIDPAGVNLPAVNLTAPGHAEPVTPVDRTEPLTGANRSIFMRLLAMTNDTLGVAMCNKDQAIVHSHDAPGIGDIDYPDGQIVTGTIAACQVFRIDDAASLYVDSLAGMAHVPVRDPNIAAGATDHVQEASSGIVGMTLHPSAPAMNRFTTFDFLDDANPANARTRLYLKDLIDPTPTNRCAVAAVTDPYLHDQVPLRQCADPADRFWSRWGTTMMALESFRFPRAARPLARAFALHGRADLFARLLVVLHAHWGDGSQSADECAPGAKPGEPYYCSGDGVVRYEPMLAELLRGDLLPALHALAVAAAATTIESKVDGGPIDGVRALAEAVRGAVDPSVAAARGVTDAAGSATATRNDGSTVAQTTPLRLLVDALKRVDARWEAWGAAHPGDDRRGAFRAGRSALVDRSFAIDGAGTPAATFREPAMPAAIAAVARLLREQADARCPGRVASPTSDACDWAKAELTAKFRDSLEGPLVSEATAVLDGLLAEPKARVAVEKLVAYLLDPSEGTFPSVVATVVDGPIAVNDGAAVGPLLAAAGPWLRTRGDGVTPADALVRSLERLSQAGLDPEKVVPVVLRQLVTPMGPGRPSPLDVFADVIGDVNRYDAARSPAPLDGRDVGVVAGDLERLARDPVRGLEQLYEVMRHATAP